MIEEAEAFCRSYGEAKGGEALAAHYLFPYISFTLGQVHSFDDAAQAIKGCSEQLERFERVGLGHDLRIPEFRVEQVAPDAALCHITWAIHPPAGIEGFQWTNVYGYRRRGEDAGFEFNISDNEIAALLQRYPDFFGA